MCHAGIVVSRPILEYPEADWDEVIGINLKGAFLVAQAAARTMIGQRTIGKIVFTSSWVQDVPWPEIIPYAISKSGMKMLMRGMARELAPTGIRVNAIAPGIVAVGMARRQWETEPDYRHRAEGNTLGIHATTSVRRGCFSLRMFCSLGLYDRSHFACGRRMQSLSTGRGCPQ